MTWERGVKNEKKVIKIKEMHARTLFSGQVVSWVAERCFFGFICQSFELCPFSPSLCHHPSKIGPNEIPSVLHKRLKNDIY